MIFAINQFQTMQSLDLWKKNLFYIFQKKIPLFIKWPS